MKIVMQWKHNLEFLFPIQEHFKMTRNSNIEDVYKPYIKELWFGSGVEFSFTASKDVYASCIK